MHPGFASGDAQEIPVRCFRRRFTPQVIEELVARFCAGDETPALSREHGASKTGLLRLLRAEGVPVRKQAITIDDAERAVQLYELG